MNEAGRPDQKVGPARAHVIETEIKGEISLFDPERNNVIVLNSTASDVWRLCDGEQTLDEIVRLLSRAYQVDPAQIRPEVTDTVDKLVREGVLASP